MMLSVSILNANNKKEMIEVLNNTNISYIHMDVMDGKFVSERTLPLEDIETLSKLTNKKLDVHLMVDNPIEYIEGIKDISNIEYITIHLEIDKDIKSILSKIREYGFKSGISIKHNTDINNLIEYIDYIDLILVMTVEPGLGGQKFIPSSIDRIKSIKKLISNSNILIEVDGGINNITIKELIDVDIAVVGSYITTSDNPIDRINDLLV